MEIKIQPVLLQEIERHALQEYPKECCGMLFGKRERAGSLKVSDIRRTHNITRVSLQKDFEISPVEIYNAEQEYEKKGLELIGIYHSHPDKKAVPSDKDKRGMLPDMAYVILSVSESRCEDIAAYEILYLKENKSEIKEIKI